MWTLVLASWQAAATCHWFQIVEAEDKSLAAGELKSAQRSCWADLGKISQEILVKISLTVHTDSTVQNLHKLNAL